MAIVGWAESPRTPESTNVEILSEIGTQVLNSGLRNDLMVRAFLQAYDSLIDSVTYVEDDVIFTLGGEPIYFQGGRMLGESRLGNREDYEPIFYSYSLQRLTEPPPLTDDPTYSSDIQENLFGQSESQIRRHGRSATFLGHRMFLNTFVTEALAAVERDLQDAAVQNREVAAWIDELDITYSFINRGIAGTSSRSFHGWGMAIDLVPTSYDGKHVFWRWSRVNNREGWHRIPMTQRWSPPWMVIQTFEEHGFVWGGKWAHFDMIHFEYRPEIILYNQLVSERENR